MVYAQETNTYQNISKLLTILVVDQQSENWVFPNKRLTTLVVDHRRAKAEFFSANIHNQICYVCYWNFKIWIYLNLFVLFNLTSQQFHSCLQQSRCGGGGSFVLHFQANRVGNHWHLLLSKLSFLFVISDVIQSFGSLSTSVLFRLASERALANSTSYDDNRYATSSHKFFFTLRG